MNTKTTAPELLTVDDAASRLCIAKRTLYRLTDGGALPVVRITPRAVRIPADAIEEFIRARTVRRAK